jgi:hypothetical protein
VTVPLAVSVLLAVADAAHPRVVAANLILLAEMTAVIAITTAATVIVLEVQMIAIATVTWRMVVIGMKKSNMMARMEMTGKVCSPQKPVLN